MCGVRHVAEAEPGGEGEEDRLEVAALLRQLVQDDLVGGQQRSHLLGGDAVHGDLVVGDAAEGDAGLGEDAGEPVGLGAAGPHDDARDALGDLLERALRLQLPERDDDRVVDGLGHLREQVGGDEHGAALAGQVTHEVAQPGDPLRVEPVGRLVEDEDVGIADEGGGQLQALAHAHGEAADLAFGVTREAHQPEHLVGALLVVTTGTGGHAQVGAGTARRMEAGRLQDGTDAGRRVGQVLVALPGDRRRAGGGVHEAQQHAQGRGLPRPVGPEKAGDASGLDREGQVVHRHHRPEALREPADLDRQPAGGGAGRHRGDVSAGGAEATGGSVTGVMTERPGQAGVRRSTS